MADKPNTTQKSVSEEAEPQGLPGDLDANEETVRPVEYTIGRLIVALVLVGGAGSFVIAMFGSLYAAVSQPPKVYLTTAKGTPKKRVLMKPARVLRCVQRLRRLDKELEHESTALWHRLRKGNRLSLRSWEDWARDWQRRMKLLQRQCPFQGSQKLPRAFQRASQRLLVLHKRQARFFARFFKKNLWLFQEIKQGMRTLKEDLP